MMDLKRRQFLQSGALAGFTLLSGKLLAAGITTPAQTEGPFYPVADQLDKDADLTRLPGAAQVAEGEQIIVEGQVLSENGRPLSGALVEVWQACATGRYNHPRDPNTSARLDPHFQYWARLLTDINGKFSFRTIKPGAYPATDTWMRPPHIHFRVDAWGRQRLTTQMYFKGEALNAQDEILNDTRHREGAAAADSLVVDFRQRRGSDGTPSGTFVIQLGRTPKAD